jgi:hypothetical protein
VSKPTHLLAIFLPFLLMVKILVDSFSSIQYQSWRPDRVGELNLVHHFSQSRLDKVDAMVSISEWRRGVSPRRTTYLPSHRVRLHIIHCAIYACFDNRRGYTDCSDSRRQVTMLCMNNNHNANVSNISLLQHQFQWDT